MFHQLSHQFSHLLPLQFSKQIVVSVAAVVLILLSIWVGFEHIQPLTTTTPTRPPSETRTRAIVLPHHDLILNEFPSFHSQIKITKPIKKIILLSPNHFEPESLVAKTTHSFLSLIDDKKIPVVENSAALFSEHSVVNDPSVFVAEHGIQLHLPYIQKYFPEAEVLPLLLTRNISKNNLNEMIATFRPMITDQTLLIVSTDFSHYLKKADAEKKDSETLHLINESRYDQILDLNDDYLDCPACMYVVMKLLDTEPRSKPEILFHSNSSEYLKQTKDEPVTSYFVIRW
jgi:poly-gamma-glutamate synthesis protein (capsule biosynthesis protein)